MNDTTKRDRRLRGWCLRSARTADKWAQKASTEAEQRTWVNLAAQFRTAAEALRDKAS